MFSRKQEQEEEKASCPFNSTHTFAKQKLIFHINRCKDGAKLAHLFTICPYNGLHHVPKNQLAQHERDCPDKEQANSLINNIRNNYEQLRERSRSRDHCKPKIEPKSEPCLQEDQHTLSECEDCLAALSRIDISKQLKLQRYLLKYQELKKDEMK